MELRCLCIEIEENSTPRSILLTVGMKKVVIPAVRMDEVRVLVDLEEGAPSLFRPTLQLLNQLWRRKLHSVGCPGSDGSGSDEAESSEEEDHDDE